MKWSDYYDRFDGWQDSTQYSRLASISDFGPSGSPSAEIADCIQYVEPRTATSIIRRTMATAMGAGITVMGMFMVASSAVMVGATGSAI